MMTWVHNHLVANWGVAIIITTLILKAVFMPHALGLPFVETHGQAPAFMQALRENIRTIRRSCR